VHRLQTTDAFIAFDFDCPVSGGGTRLAPDVSEEEVKLLARAMSYKFAVLGARLGGAKAAIRARPEERREAISRYCAEILPLVRSRRFLTSTDLGTYPEDFAALPEAESPNPGVELTMTGLGVVVAAEVALGGLEGARIALEGFGKVGGATAEAAAARGARLVAVSTVHGCVRRPDGFDAGELLALRERHGDRLVEHVGTELLPPGALYETPADVLVPGARTGSLDEERAARVPARVVAPAANVPYTEAGLRALAGSGVVALPDFVCNCGATLSYLAPAGSGEAAVAELVESTVADLTRRSLAHPDGPFAGGCAVAEEFLRTWVDAEQVPARPPLA